MSTCVQFVGAMDERIRYAEDSGVAVFCECFGRNTVYYPALAVCYRWYKAYRIPHADYIPCLQTARLIQGHKKEIMALTILLGGVLDRETLEHFIEGLKASEL